MAQSTLASPLASRARWTLNPRRRRTLTAYLLISPWLLGFVVLTLGPMLFSLYASFTRYDIVNAPRWTGLTNYKFSSSTILVFGQHSATPCGMSW